jgi:aminoglycoside/choline kinase family phosphotransferase
MSERDASIRRFIVNSGWGDADIGSLAGDASNRRYLRLRRDGESAVLMDAPSEKGEDIRPFVYIARYLDSIGLSAPRILAADEAQGLMLLEDLGDDIFARIITRRPDMENSLYSCATDLLSFLHSQTAPAGLDPYDVSLMADMAILAHDWYMKHSVGKDPSTREALHGAVTEALMRNAPDQSTLIQRDYHSENLLWLPSRVGVARVGLLDFQDAMLGHPAYDLVSLLQDARRDVAPEVEASMLQRYIAANSIDEVAFRAAYHTLGAQRNLRILGVFARLCLRDGKAHYIDLMPRVWGLLQRDLSHPALRDLSQVVTSNLPEPTPQILKDLKDKCATVPAQ